jgi:hypothetical protein
MNFEWKAFIKPKATLVPFAKFIIFQERQTWEAAQVDPGTPEGLDVQPVHGGVHADLQEVAQAHGPALHQVKNKKNYRNFSHLQHVGSAQVWFFG